MTSINQADAGSANAIVYVRLFEAGNVNMRTAGLVTCGATRLPLNWTPAATLCQGWCDCVCARLCRRRPPTTTRRDHRTG